MTTPMRQFYEGRSVFLTGCTGFVGKVILEKILRDLPNVNRIFILIRSQKNFSAAERLQREVFGSPIFERLRKERPDFDQYTKQKVVVIAGDVLAERLGISDSDYQTLINEVNIVIHCAAAIGFQERLDNAIRSNVLGPLRVLELSRSLKNLVSHVHVSTAYVNSNLKDSTRVEEKLYPLDKTVGDPEQFVKTILAMENPLQIEKITPSLIGRYPNTYTFTKSVTEHLLVQKAGGIPLAIVRPTIVGAAWKEPTPGWIDAVSAAGAVYYLSGVGVVSILPGNPNNISDQIPVDFVSNLCLVAAYDVVKRYNSGYTTPRIYHCGSSCDNPVCWRDAFRYVIDWWVQHRPNKSIVPRAKLQIIKTSQMYRATKFIKYTAPIKAFSAFANTVGTKKNQRLASDLNKLEERVGFVGNTFKHFTLNQWIFLTNNTKEALANLENDCPEDKEVFGYDMKSLDWLTYLRYFAYGLQTYVMKENVVPPFQEQKFCVIKKDDSGFMSDLYWAFKSSPHSHLRPGSNLRHNVKKVRQIVLSSARVQEAIRASAVADGVAVAKMEERATEILDRMCADLHMPVVRCLAYFFRKVWKKIYKSITVDELGIEKYRELAEKTKGPMVIIPTHRSYVDFLILSYIFFAYDLPIPHIAAGEDFLNMALVRSLFRKSGAFYMRRYFGNDQLYKAIFTSYVQYLISQGIPVEFFTEGTRSRAGKLLQPKMGLLTIITETFFEKRIPDICFVPINITYEKVIEGNSYVDELLGKMKTPESLRALIGARDVLKRNFGRIAINFGHMFSMTRFLSEFTEQEQQKRQIRGEQQSALDPFTNKNDRAVVVRNLAYRVAYELNQAAVVMPTNMVAAILLTFRGGIAYDQLKDKLEYLRDEILLRGGKVEWDVDWLRNKNITERTDMIIRDAIALLSDLVIQNRPGIYEPAIVSGKSEEMKNLLLLGFYRNQITHLFFLEGLCACALLSFGDEKAFSAEGVDRRELVKEINFLYNLLMLESIHKPNQDPQEDFDAILDQMINRGYLVPRGVNGDRIAASSTAGGTIQPLFFLCNMFWPFIDSYWIAAVVFHSHLLYDDDNNNNNSNSNNNNNNNNNSATAATATATAGGAGGAGGAPSSPTMRLRGRTVIHEKTLIQRMQWLAEKLYNENRLSYFESCSMDTLKNATKQFMNLGIITRKKLKGESEYTIVATDRYNANGGAAFTELVDHIKRFRKIPSANAAMRSGMIPGFDRVLSRL